MQDDRLRKDAVIIVTPWFPNSPGEREGNYIHDSARAISELGWPVSALVTRPFRPSSVGPWVAKQLGVALNPRSFVGFDQIGLVHHLSVPRNLTPRVSDALLDRAVISALRRMVKDTSARVIHVHTESLAPAAVAVGRLTGTKVVVTLHGVNVGPRYFGRPSRRRRFRDALAAADKVILVGEPLREFFRELVGHDDHFRVVPNGFTLKAVARSSTVLCADRALHFISVSNLHEGKGVDVNLEALFRLNREGLTNWTYTIVGDGDQRACLEALVHQFGLESKVQFSGARPHGEIPRLLSAADVFILPSYREAFGIAYLEAMAAGLLVVGVRDQGPSAFIEHGVSGLLVPPRDPEALCQQLAVIIRDVESFRGIATNAARVSVDRFTWCKHADQVASVYRELLETAP
jgi:glycosyltransferase involved in cell wall biosynthesis